MSVSVSAGGSFSVAFPAVTQDFTLPEIEFSTPVGTPVFGGIASGKILPGNSPVSCGVEIVDTLASVTTVDSVVLKATLKNTFSGTGATAAASVNGWRFSGTSHITLQGWLAGTKTQEQVVTISNGTPLTDFGLLGVLQTLTLPSGDYDEIRASLLYGLYNINIDPGLFLNAANFGYTFSQYWKTVSSGGGGDSDCTCGDWTRQALCAGEIGARGADLAFSGSRGATTGGNVGGRRQC